MARLLVDSNTIETPFIIVKIGGYTFGKATASGTFATGYSVTYPNYVQSLRIIKTNGEVNRYTLQLDYAITQFDDPNKLDKIFSSISKSREIEFCYGDYNNPQFIYRNETALITKLGTNVDVAGQKISYTIQATGTPTMLNAGKHHFPGMKVKGSDALKMLLRKNSYEICNIFTAMKDWKAVEQNHYIASDDEPIDLKEQYCSVLTYINYVVDCMTANNSNSTINKSVYKWCIKEDPQVGMYFQVKKVGSSLINSDSYNTYEVDVGYPGQANVVAFSIKNDDSYSILYDYSSKIEQPNYTYTINDEGNLDMIYSPTLTSSNTYLGTTTADDKNWWSQMTQFPIQGSITIKGLLRPILLMQYIRIRVWFYGKLHMSSGLYFINKQEDQLDSSGYKTTLGIQKIGEDNTTVR